MHAPNNAPVRYVMCCDINIVLLLLLILFLSLEAVSLLVAYCMRLVIMMSNL